jgi:hypothetical protein
MAKLDKTYYDLDFPLYRGTHRQSEKNVSDVIEYDKPSSWSSDFNVALNFIQGEETPVLLRLLTTGLIKSIENTKNTYEEREFILYSCKLEITGTNIDRYGYSIRCCN